MRLKKLLTSALAVSLAAASVVSVVPTAFAATASSATPNIYIVGDVDLDGKITSADSLKIQRYLNGKETFTNIQKYLADVNGDNKVNQTDVTGTLEYSVGKNTANNKNAGSSFRADRLVTSLSFVDNKCTNFTFSNSGNIYIYKNNPFVFNANANFYMSTKLVKSPSNACEKITYTSSNPSLAKVDTNGNVTFQLKEIKLRDNSTRRFCQTGTVLITATSSITKKSVSCYVIVSDFYDNLAFSFVNSKVSDNRKIYTFNDYSFLFENQIAGQLYSAHINYVDKKKKENEENGISQDKFTGHCYGMSLMSCLFNSSDSGLKVTDFYHKNSKGETTTQLKSIKDLTLTDVYKGSITRYKDKTLQDFLSGLQQAQKAYGLSLRVGETKNDFEGFVKAVKDVEKTKQPVLFGYGGAHAVVGYKVVEATVKEGDRETTYADKSYKGRKVKRLYYYDCNEPADKDRYVSFFVDKNGKIDDWRLKVSNLVYSPEKTDYLKALGEKEKPDDKNDKVYLIKDKNGKTQRFVAECGTDYVDSVYTDGSNLPKNYLSVWNKGKQGKLT